MINIFVDLDETLIHTSGMDTITGQRGNEAPSSNIKIELDGVRYYPTLRPGANYLLFQLRSIGRVFMLTRAVKDYARAMNKEFGFGFTDDKIFDRKYVKNWKYKKPDIPKAERNFLIDDLPIIDNYEKIAFIKTHSGPVQYIKVPAFWGFNNESLTHEYIKELIELILEPEFNA